MTRACPFCGRQMRHGKSAIHLSGDCTKPFYAERKLPPLKRTKRGRPRGIPNGAHRPDDISPELMERIMKRRAAEQRWERARGLA